jgi:hypothetical protein
VASPVQQKPVQQNNCEETRIVLYDPKAVNYPVLQNTGFCMTMHLLILGIVGLQPKTFNYLSAQVKSQDEKSKMYKIGSILQPFSVIICILFTTSMFCYKSFFFLGLKFCVSHFLSFLSEEHQVFVQKSLLNLFHTLSQDEKIAEEELFGYGVLTKPVISYFNRVLEILTNAITKILDTNLLSTSTVHHNDLSKH